MAVWSKLASGLEEVPCKTIAHSWTNSCLLAAADIFIASCFGSAGFFSLLYFCQYVSLVLKKKKKPSLKDYLQMMSRSVFFGASVATGTISMSCLLRNLLGRYYYLSVVLIPASIGGIFIFSETKKGRELATNAFVNCVLEFWIRVMQGRNILRWTPNHQTAVFMIVSSVLSYLLSLSTYNQQFFWFFMPPKIDNRTKEDKLNVCFHKGSCWKHNLYLFFKYSSTGFILQLVRSLVDNLRTPKKVFSSLATLKPFKLAAFLGSYVVMYESIRCCLYRRKKKHSSTHDSIAGLIAGAAFRFQPTFPILNSGIIAIVQILTEIACRRQILPNIPYLEFVFIVFCGMAFHARILHSEYCPPLMVYIMSAVTRLRSDHVFQNYNNMLKNLKCNK